MSNVSARNKVLCALFTALIAVGAWIQIPLPFLSVTLQTFFVLTAGYLLGAKLAALSATLYMVIGLMGVPVFSGGGGLSYVLRPSFGYIIGFVVGAWVTGFLTEQIARNPAKEYTQRKVKQKNDCIDQKRRQNKTRLGALILAGTAGLACIYLIGILYFTAIHWLYLKDGMAFSQIFLYCFVLCIPGDAISCVMAAFVARRLRIQRFCLA